jgi:hypothetical protein
LPYFSAPVVGFRLRSYLRRNPYLGGRPTGTREIIFIAGVTLIPIAITAVSNITPPKII